MITVVLDEVNDTDAVSHFSLMRLYHSLKVFGFIGSAVNEYVLI